MSNQTATHTAAQKAEDEDQLKRVHYMLERFARRYTPTDRRDQAEFTADLTALILEAQRSALAPFHRVVCDSLSAQPITPYSP